MGVGDGPNHLQPGRQVPDQLAVRLGDGHLEAEEHPHLLIQPAEEIIRNTKVRPVGYIFIRDMYQIYMIYDHVRTPKR